MLPRDRFDPAYYRERYDPKGKIKRGFLFDYRKRGRVAGWKPVSVASTLAFDTSRIDPLRETVLMISHQASRTGAPILAYNIALNLSHAIQRRCPAPRRRRIGRRLQSLHRSRDWSDQPHVLASSRH